MHIGIKEVLPCTYASKVNSLTSYHLKVFKFVGLIMAQLKCLSIEILSMKAITFGQSTNNFLSASQPYLCNVPFFMLTKDIKNRLEDGGNDA